MVPRGAGRASQSSAVPAGQAASGREMMIRKVLPFALAAAVALLIAGQRQDIARYVKIKQMSTGEGHPENVPAGGSQAYPAPGKAVPDGTGDFDSASRGGPATRP